MAKHIFHFQFDDDTHEAPAKIQVGIELELSGSHDSRDRFILGEQLANKLGLTFSHEERIYHLNHDF